MAAAVGSTPGVRLLNQSSDTAHNRSVLTFAGGAGGVQEAVLALFERAIADIDLRGHEGVHPRLGFLYAASLSAIGSVIMWRARAER